MTQRDFVGEIRAIIDAETAEGPYYVSSTAERIVAKLFATDRELLEGWLRSQAEAVMRDAINRRNASVRSHARDFGARSVFAEDAKSGDTRRMLGWLEAPFTIADGSKKTLGTMTKDDVLHVAEGYGKRAAANQLRSEFLRVLSAKMRTKSVTVSEVYDNETLDRIWHSMSG